MIRKRPKKPDHDEIFGKYRMSYGEPKEFAKRILHKEDKVDEEE